MDVCFYIGHGFFVRTSGNAELAGRYMFIETYEKDPYEYPDDFDKSVIAHIGLDAFEWNKESYERYVEKYGDEAMNNITKCLDEIANLDSIRSELAHIARELILYGEYNIELNTQKKAMSVSELLFGGE
jgi:hypothetical protein